MPVGVPVLLFRAPLGLSLKRISGPDVGGWELSDTGDARQFRVFLRRDVDDVVTASDAQLVDAMRFFAERMKIIVEPTGCLAAAAVMQGTLPLAGKRVGVIVSGGNVDLQRFAQLVARP